MRSEMRFGIFKMIVSRIRHTSRRKEDIRQLHLCSQ